MTSFFLLPAIMLAVSTLASPVSAQTYPGLPTRSQTPLLQGYYIPAIPITTDADWSFSQSLYITNTYQKDQNSDEALEIDVENTRLDFQFSYRHQLWHFNTNLSLISNRKGFLDQTIERWHDIFMLPQGGRKQVLNDQLRLYYQNPEGTLFDISQTSDGLADIQLALGYQLTPSTQVWGSVELPSSNTSEPISNDEVDAALWISNQSKPNARLIRYHSLGLVIHGDDGLFKQRLKNEIVFAQAGVIYTLTKNYQLLLQADYHSKIVDGSELDAFSHSLQAQFGLRLPSLWQQHTLELFFSEDIVPGHAPDITFGLRISPSL